MILTRLGILFFVTLLGSQKTLVNGGDMGEQPCPIDCECHYFRINWITDCSESNLTNIPYDELSPNVYILDMNGNRVEHLDPFPKNIEKLRGLQMAHNRLTKLEKASFEGLQYLVEADFSSNFITEVEPSAFSDSHGLLTLELHNNPLNEVKQSFLDCKTLTYLDLSSCGIKELHVDFFNNITKLKKLDLSGNPFNTIAPGYFDNLLNLEYLKLNNCSLTNIDPSAFKNLESLRELELSNNTLKNLEWTKVLAPLIRLEYLNIANTDIRKLPSDAFAQNHYLRHLDLSNNILHHLDIEHTLGHNLHNLAILDLSNCSLQERLSEETFRNSSKLTKLNLSGNSMLVDDLAAVLQHMPKLTELSLSNCSLKKLPKTFDVLQDLRILDISYNAMSDAFVTLLTPLKSLEYLDMSYCNLGYVGKDTFTLMTELKTLILSGNQLETLERDLFANLTKLQRLELKNCHFRTPLDSKVFGNCEIASLIQLSLSGNPLAIPKNGSLLSEQLSSVEKLDLSNCSITNLNDNIFLYNENITELNLSNNKLSGDLGFLKNLSRLTNLNLSHNNLTTIKPNMLAKNNQLMKLYLIGNPFVCNCSITEMWDWAIDKVGGKDLYDFLIGSQPTEFGAGIGKLGAAKVKKSLSCAYDNETYKNMKANKMQERNGKSISRKGDFTQYRTWAKFVRESRCNSTS